MTPNVCPFYRLPQLKPGELLTPEERCPRCAAFNNNEPIEAQQARRLCRTSAYPSCQRFQLATPQRGSYARRHLADQSLSEEPTLLRQLLQSAVWVIGIPVVITLAIVVALWITEHVWVVTETGNIIMTVHEQINR
jgi:hypothetical protein